MTANPDDRTVLSVPLPAPVAPGETVELEIEWSSRVPRTFARTGRHRRLLLPRALVPEDRCARGERLELPPVPRRHRVLRGTNGIYDVRITVPRRLGGGRHGHGAERHRQRRRHGDAPLLPGRRARLRLDHQPRLRRAPRALRAPGPAGRRHAACSCNREHAGQEARHFEATAHTLRLYGEWFGPYPYEQVTIVDPAWQSRSGGMEYPTFFTAGTRWLAPENVSSPEEVTVHEAGPPVLAHRRRQQRVRACLDRRRSQHLRHRACTRGVLPGETTAPRASSGGSCRGCTADIPWSRAIHGNRLSGYRRDAPHGYPSRTPTYLYWPGSASSISYNKTAPVAAHAGALSRLADPAARHGRTSSNRWRFGHPGPEGLLPQPEHAGGARPGLVLPPGARLGRRPSTTGCRS